MARTLTPEDLIKNHDLRVLGLLPVRTIARAVDESSSQLRKRALSFKLGVQAGAGNALYDAFAKTTPDPPEVEVFLPPNDAARLARASLGNALHNLDRSPAGRVSSIQLEVAFSAAAARYTDTLDLGTPAPVDDEARAHLLLCGIQARKVAYSARHRWLARADIARLAQEGPRLAAATRQALAQIADAMPAIDEAPVVVAPRAPVTTATPIKDALDARRPPLAQDTPETLAGRPEAVAPPDRTAQDLANLKLALEICEGAESLDDARYRDAICARALKLAGVEWRVK